MTVVRARYYPSMVQLPDEPLRRKQYVLLGQGGDNDGLHVWSRPGDVADVHLPVDWSRTRIPSDRQARNGVDVYLADGRLAIITAGSSCRCGSLARWPGPIWANTVAARV